MCNLISLIPTHYICCQQLMDRYYHTRWCENTLVDMNKMDFTI